MITVKFKTSLSSVELADTLNFIDELIKSEDSCNKRDDVVPVNNAKCLMQDIANRQEKEG